MFSNRGPVNRGSLQWPGAATLMTVRDHSPLTIDQLVGGPNEPILVVDFIQFSAARPLSEILGSHSQDHPVYRADPVTDLTRDQAYWPLDELADGYSALCRQRGLGRGRLIIVGYCSAAGLSGQITARLARQADLSLFLVDPVWPDAELTAEHFMSFRASLGATPSPAPGGHADPRLALRDMLDVLRDDLHAMALSRGLDPVSPSLGDLLERYRAWLGFLLASQAVRGRPWPDGVHPQVLPGADGELLIPHAEPGSYRVIPQPASGSAPPDEAGIADAVLAHAWRR
jgi:hypothetical protein